MRASLSLALCLALAQASLAHAEPDPAEEATSPAGDEAAQGGEGTDEEAAMRAEMRAFEASLDFQRGKVTVGDDLATLDVPESFGFLDAEDADRLLQAWGNPPSSALGALVPSGVSVFDDESWAVIVYYTEEGHIEDDDADDIDYDDLLADMKSDAEDANAQRLEEGYSEMHIVGWAEPPSYDKGQKKMYWAKELDFGTGEHTLNYDIRVLGRKGVLELSAVASMSQLGMIKAEMPKVMSFVEFNPGNTYADFDPDIDDVAAYGIGALVAGKVAAKAGLFKLIVAGLLASKKALIAGLIAIGAGIKALLGRRKEDDEVVETSES